jgi:predicted nuclease of predicted toxin-antitoxin system
VILWLDAHLPPVFARFLRDELEVKAVPVRDLGLRDAGDRRIFEAARAASAVLLTKDRDFLELLDRLGPPPQILWLTLGNTSNEALKALFRSIWPRVRVLLEAQEPLIEIGQRQSGPSG